jgi:hypothetical protein
MAEQRRPAWVDRLDWHELLPRLRLKASRLFGSKELAEEFVGRAIELSFTTRPWNPNGKYDYYAHAVGIMRSLRHHHFRSAFVRHEIQPGEESIIQFPDWNTPEKIAINNIDTKKFLLHLASKNEKACTVAVLMYDGLRTSRDLAEEMGLTINQVAYLKQKLQEITEEYLGSTGEVSTSFAHKISARLATEE